MISRAFATFAFSLIAALVCADVGIAIAQNTSGSGDLRQALFAVPVSPGAGLFQTRSTEQKETSAEVTKDGPILRRRDTAIDAGYLNQMLAANAAISADGKVTANAVAFSMNLLPDVT